MGVPSGFRVLVAKAPRTLKPSLMACTPFRAVPDRADASPSSFFSRVLLPPTVSNTVHIVEAQLTRIGVGGLVFGCCSRVSLKKGSRIDQNMLGV